MCRPHYLIDRPSGLSCYSNFIRFKVNIDQWGNKKVHIPNVDVLHFLLLPISKKTKKNRVFCEFHVHHIASNSASSLNMMK